MLKHAASNEAEHGPTWCGEDGERVFSWSRVTCYDCLDSGRLAGETGATEALEAFLTTALPPSRDPDDVEAWLDA